MYSSGTEPYTGFEHSKRTNQYTTIASTDHFQLGTLLLEVSLQWGAIQTAHLVNNHYQNEVTLTGQNPTLKCG